MNSKLPSTESITAFDVFLNEVQVGSLTYNKQADLTTFMLSEGYMNMQEPPILSLSYKGRTQRFTKTREQTMINLPPFFSNLLPEKGPLRNFLLKQASLKQANDFTMLSLLREDLPGAVLLKPAPGQPQEIERDYQLALLTNHSSTTDKPFRFSLAGVHMKFSARLTEDGFRISNTGENGDWIIKLPHPTYEKVPQNEFATMRFAQQVSINVPATLLIPQKEIAGLPAGLGNADEYCYAVKRFDRTETGRRIHIEDFAQVYGQQPTNKYAKTSYQNIASVIWSEDREQGVVEFTKRLAFCILTGNHDMHLKNWSMIYRDPTHPELSPAYDLLSSAVYPVLDQEMALSLSGTKDTGKITMQHFKKMAADAKLPEKLIVKTVEQTVKAVREYWSDYLKEFTEGLAERLDNYAKGLPLMAEAIPHMVSLNTEKRKTTSDEEWLKRELQREFEDVKPTLYEIREGIKNFAEEKQWSELPDKASLDAIFNINELNLRLNFGGWTNTEGILQELISATDKRFFVRIRGPHLLVSFHLSDGAEVQSMVLQYHIYNGRPSWRTVEPGNNTTQILSAADLIQLIKSQAQSLSPKGKMQEQATLSIQYLTAQLKLIELVDESNHIRGSLLLANNDLIAILGQLKLARIALPSSIGQRTNVPNINLEQAKVFGLYGRFITDREKERASKEIISEKIDNQIAQIHLNKPEAQFWIDTDSGATHVVQISGTQHKLEISLRELISYLSDRTIASKIDSKLAKFVGGLDQR